MFSLKTPFIYDFQGNGVYVVESEALGDCRLHLAPLQGNYKIDNRRRSNLYILYIIAGSTL